MLRTMVTSKTLHEIRIDTLPQWLKEHGFSDPGLHLEELGGGVSNIVVLAECGQFRLIVKQALGQLRVAEEWRCDRGRIFREAAAMRWLAGRTTAGQIP